MKRLLALSLLTPLIFACALLPGRIYANWRFGGGVPLPGVPLEVHQGISGWDLRLETGLTTHTPVLMVSFPRP